MTDDRKRTTTRRASAMALAALLLAAPAAARRGADDAPGDDRGGDRSEATCTARTLSELVAPTGLDADGTARARWRQDARCRADFGVELEDVPVGDYALLVDGVARGTIAVVPDATGGTRGEIEFEAVDDTPHPLTLDFDPLGAVVEIRAGGAIWFADVFDGSGVAPPATTATAVRTRTPLPPLATTPTAAATRQVTSGARSTPTAVRTPATTRTRTRTIAPTRTPTRPRPTRTATPPRTRTGSSGSSTRWSGWSGWGWGR